MSRLILLTSWNNKCETKWVNNIVPLFVTKCHLLYNFTNLLCFKRPLIYHTQNIIVLEFMSFDLSHEAHTQYPPANPQGTLTTASNSRTGAVAVRWSFCWNERE